MRAGCVLVALVASLAAQVQSKAVFAHFMVGNANNYTQSDWETDISLAQEAHIDAFALNIANDVVGVTPALQLAFYVASQKGFNLFFSFDYAGNGPWHKDDVIALCTSYCNNPAYYHTNGGPLLTTFEGPGNATDWHEIKASTGCFFIPDWSSLGAKVALEQADGVADGLFNWAAWPWGDHDMDTYTDASYWMYLGQAGGKPYMMPASPWFYTNLPGYDKNWLWRGDASWYDRWVQIIYNQPDFVEIISWNDYGESHYIGPLYDKAMEAFTIGKAPFNYANNMPHDGWRAFLPYVIDLYKTGTATITQEGIQGWWRRAAGSACGTGGTTGNTASQLELEFAPSAILTDKIFFSALLGSHADVSVTVGGTTLKATWSRVPDDGIGIYHGSADFGTATGDVVIQVSRSGRAVATLQPGSSGSIGTQSCVNGLQNWNAFVASAWGDGISATPTRKISEQKCINGTGYGNFAGICDFACKYGYCDHSACVCKAMGSPSATPSGVAPTGYPAAGLDASYSGVCAFDCEHGYCPPAACSYEESPLTTPTVSDFSPPACIAGSAIAGENSALGGLCSYACNFGFCPYLVCHCDSQGALHETPPKIDGRSGKAADGVEDHDLCSFACERGYCPAPTCVDTTSTGSGSGSTDPGGIGALLGDPGWYSFTGQDCYKSECAAQPLWSDDENLAASSFPDDCPPGQYRVVICPLNGTPGNCRWRGNGPLCSPVCAPDEVAIATSAYGSEACLVGQQGLCCTSNTWARLIRTCSWTTTDCGAGLNKVASRKAWRCDYSSPNRYQPCTRFSLYDVNFCCAADFPNCEWGDCQTGCNSQQIEIAQTSNNVVGYQSCGPLYAGDPLAPSTPLCCDNPSNVNPFLPVPLARLFPTLPPATDIPVFNVKHIESQQDDTLQVGPLEPFGMVVIDGPADLVASLSKRDGSHVEFLDCEPSKKHDMTVYTARYICTNDSDESNCDDVHMGGAEGTVVKLPEECGYATYGVVHNITRSSSQQVPHELRKLAPRGVVVHEVSFSYDFRKVRRAASDDAVYVRIDYSSMSDWWYEIVEAPTSGKRDLNANIRKRFWSKSDDEWKNKIAQVRQSTNNDDEKLLPMRKSFSNLLYHQTSETCAAPGSKRALSDDGFLSVSLDGWIVTNLRWGYTMVGTISPNLNLEEAHGFFDAQITSAGTLSVDGSGDLEISGSLPVSELMGADGFTDFGWDHPGIVSFKPTLNMAVEMSGSGHFDGNFTVDYLTLPGPDIIQINSPNMGNFSGSVGSTQLSNAFKGAVTVSETSHTDSSGVVFGLRIIPQSKMDFTVFDYSGTSKATLESRSVALASAEFGIQLMHKIQVKGNGTGVQVIDSYDPIDTWINSDNVSPSWTNVDNADVLLGPGASPAVIYTGAGATPPPRAPPGTSGGAVLTGDFMHCSGSRSITCLFLANVSSIDTDLLDDFDGENEAAYEEDQLRRRAGIISTHDVPFADVAERIKPSVTRRDQLLPRATAAARSWPITPPSGRVFNSLSSPYLTGNQGRVLTGVNPQAGYYSLENQFDCLGAAITDNAGPASDQSSEHLPEQNLIASFWQFMMTGRVPATSQSIAVVTTTEVVPEALVGEHSVFRAAWEAWDTTAPQGTHEDDTLEPEREMWDAIGSLRHPEYLVNLQQTINGFKSRMMRGIAGIGDTRWSEFQWDDTSEATGFGHAIEALSEIRLFEAVINYLNHPAAHTAFIASLNRINDIMNQFDDAVSRNNLNNGRPTNAGPLWREFVYRVIIRRTEGTYGQYRRLLWRIRQNWQSEYSRSAGASAARVAEIESIIAELVVLLGAYDPMTGGDFQIDTTGLFPDPT